MRIIFLSSITNTGRTSENKIVYSAAYQSMHTTSKAYRKTLLFVVGQKITILVMNSTNMVHWLDFFCIARHALNRAIDL